MGLGGKLARGFFSGATAAIPGAVDSLNQARNRNQQQSQFLASQAQQKSQFETTEERLSTEAENRLTAQNEANRIAQSELALRQQGAHDEEVRFALGTVRSMTTRAALDAYQPDTAGWTAEEVGLLESARVGAIGGIAETEKLRKERVQEGLDTLERTNEANTKIAREQRVTEQTLNLISAIQNYTPSLAKQFADTLSDGKGDVYSDYSDMLGALGEMGLDATDYPLPPTNADLQHEAQIVTEQALANNKKITRFEAINEARRNLMPERVRYRRHMHASRMSKALPPDLSLEDARAMLEAQFPHMPHFIEDALQMYANPASMANQEKESAGFLDSILTGLGIVGAGELTRRGLNRVGGKGPTPRLGLPENIGPASRNAPATPISPRGNPLTRVARLGGRVAPIATGAALMHEFTTGVAENLGKDDPLGSGVGLDFLFGDDRALAAQHVAAREKRAKEAGLPPGTMIMGGNR